MPVLNGYICSLIDKSPPQDLYDRVENIATIDYDVTFYCKGDFIKKVKYTDANNVAQEAWSDTAYTYTDSQGVVQNVPLLRVAPANKPAPGRPDSGSFTTIGQYDFEVLTNFSTIRATLLTRNRFQGNIAQWRCCRLQRPSPHPRQQQALESPIAFCARPPSPRRGEQ